MADTYEIDPGEDMIDSRGVIARIRDLRTWRDDADAEWFGQNEADELADLEALQAEAECSPDWQYGETLIADHYFRDYAQELAEDCGMIPRDLSWPLYCIDWDHAADELKYDYFRVSYAGRPFWILG